MSRFTYLVCVLFFLYISVVYARPSADQLLDEAMPAPPHHHHGKDPQQQQHDKEDVAAYDEGFEPSVSIPLSPEDTALLTTQISIPALSEELPVHYQHPPLSFNLNKKQDKLQNALNTVVNVAHNKASQIKREKAWSKKVANLVDELSVKKLKVENHLKSLSDQIRAIFQKKKRIQNAILQRRLAKKLKKTHRNLKRVRRFAYHLSKQELLYNKHKEELSHAVENLQRSIALLRGVHRKKNYDLPAPGTAEKLLQGWAKLDPEYQSSHMEEQKEVDRLTDIHGRRRK